jgi:hypothetical protein
MKLIMVAMTDHNRKIQQQCDEDRRRYLVEHGYLSRTLTPTASVNEKEEFTSSLSGATINRTSTAKPKKKK